MNRILATRLFVAATVASRVLASNVFGTSVREIPVDDIKPSGFALEYCWEAIGIDPTDRVYFGFGDGNDVAVFRYDPSSDERKFLGTLRQTVANAGNLHEGEPIPKGHAHFPYYAGKMYIATQGFHDLNSVSAITTDLKKYRGAHIVTVDTETGRMDDLSASLPDGVFVKNQGLVDLRVLPSLNLLVGLCHPLGDIMVYHLESGTVKLLPGVDAELGNQICRDFAVTPDGKVFWSYGFSTGNVYCYDLRTEKRTKLSVTTQAGFWNGSTYSCDRSDVFISTYDRVYRVDYENNTLKTLARVPDAWKIWCLTLSLDERSLYVIPSEGAKSLFEIDVRTGGVTRLIALGGKAYTGSDVRDSKGRIYVVKHSYGSGAALVRIDVSDRTGPAPCVPTPVALGAGLGPRNRHQVSGPDRREEVFDTRGRLARPGTPGPRKGGSGLPYDATGPYLVRGGGKTVRWQRAAHATK